VQAEKRIVPGNRAEWDQMEKIESGSGNRLRRRIEKVLLACGALLLGIYLAALLHSVILSRIALWRFQNAYKANASPVTGVLAATNENVNTSLWSGKRIEAYKESLVSKFDAPLGVLRIPKLNLVVPVFEGTDDLTLNRGVGRIAGTAQLGGAGNVGIAGHRDGFFRPLKDIRVGDSIELLVESKPVGYVVRSIEIVKPQNTDVLKATGDPQLTLVTCYPFYFVGNAPQRFIVHASLAGARAGQ
jgi:sortase A